MSPSPKVIALGVVAALGAAAVACSASNSACFRNCPPMEGAWLVTFESATDPAECRQIGVTAPDGGTLAITRQTSQLSATFAGQQLDGTVYDTWDFTLDGQAIPDGGVDAYSFRGSFIAGRDAGPAADGGQGDAGNAGDQLSGLYDATLQRPGPQGTVTCHLVRSYSASRK